jgi:hypothetical protein
MAELKTNSTAGNAKIISYDNSLYIIPITNYLNSVLNFRYDSLEGIWGIDVPYGVKDRPLQGVYRTDEYVIDDNDTTPGTGDDTYHDMAEWFSDKVLNIYSPGVAIKGDQYLKKIQVRPKFEWDTTNTPGPLDVTVSTGFYYTFIAQASQYSTYHYDLDGCGFITPTQYPKELSKTFSVSSSSDFGDLLEIELGDKDLYLVGPLQEEGSFKFPGSVDSAGINFGPNSVFDDPTTQPYSVSMWVKPNELGVAGGSGRSGRLFSIGTWSSTVGHGFLIGIYKSATTDLYSFHIYQATTDNSSYNLHTSIAIPDNELDKWYHIVATFDYDAPESTLTLYLDGEYANDVSYSAYPPKPPNTNEDAWVLRYSTTDTSPPDGEHISTVNLVAIWDEVLAAGAIRDLYNNPMQDLRNNTNKYLQSDALRNYWKFNINSDVVTDLCEDNNGVVNNSYNYMKYETPALTANYLDDSIIIYPTMDLGGLSGWSSGSTTRMFIDWREVTLHMIHKLSFNKSQFNLTAPGSLLPQFLNIENYITTTFIENV